ncbi:MAG: hypothetical protein KatS3mg081_2636 [Gemmatimonadales bacterium]|nr:MAG: hypothetical protein KatS3mg081_2636 [Gemmatimonadales bacterium]
MNCYRCHTPIPAEARFCISCGADLSDPSAAGSSTTAAMDAAAAERLLRMLQEEVGSEFAIERELGRGGMAVVYLATDVQLERKVAIKVLPPELTFGSGAIERFKREARTAATLDHPNIIPIYRISATGRLFWYSMKYLVGPSLAKILDQEGRLSLADTIKVLEQVAAALDYAHARNIIHRDIKPANIMLDDLKRVVVTDFGIAKQLTAGSFTASGSVIGTPYYMSPEQCSGSKTLTGAADQYAVGVMTYQMLAGQVPFEGESAVDILTKHVMQPPPPLDVLRPGLPSHVYGAVERALAKKPEERFPSVGAFVEALKHPPARTTAAARPRTSLSSLPTVTLRQPSFARKVGPRAALIASAILLAGVGAIAVRRWIAQPRPATERDVERHSALRREEVPRATGSGGPRASADSTSTAHVTTAASRQGLSAGPQQAPTGGAGTTTAAAISTRAAGTPPSATEVLGTLTVRIANGPARLYVDGMFRAETPSHREKLRPGLHRLRLERPGYRTLDTTVVITEGGDSELRLSLEPEPPPPSGEQRDTTAAEPREPAGEPPTVGAGVVVIRTLGGWARIFINDRFVREGTSFRDSFPAGTHRIRLEREGFVTVDTTLTVVAGQEHSITITMRRRGP